MQNQTDQEGYRGVGRADRRRMVRMWRASGTDLSLKEWAAQQGVGDIADVWIKSKSKRRSNP